MGKEDFVRVNVYIPRPLYKQAKDMGIKFSEVLRKALYVEIAVRKKLLKEFKESYALMSLEGEKSYEELGIIDWEAEESPWDDDSGGWWDDESGAP